MKESTTDASTDAEKENEFYNIIVNDASSQTETDVLVATTGMQTEPLSVCATGVDFAGMADSSVIFRETEFARPEASHKAEWDARVQHHQKTYHGGTLPCELRSWAEYWARLKRRLSAEDIASLRCQFCGQTT